MLQALRHWLAPPRHILVIFLAITLLPAAALGWLTWRLIEQESSLARQRLQERVEHAADRIVAASQKRLSDLETSLKPAPLSPPEDSVLIETTKELITAIPANGLLYYPVIPESKELPGSTFADGEQAEFQSKDARRAATVFRNLTTHPDPAIRAGALLRLGRNLRKTGDVNGALRAFDELATLDPVRMAGLPASLLAMASQCSALEEAGRKEDLAKAVVALAVGLQHGRWSLLRAQYELYRQEARRWSESAVAAEDRNRRAIADAFEWLWQQLQDGAAPRSRQFLLVKGLPVALAWNAKTDGVQALIAGPDYVAKAWRESPGIRAMLSDSSGNVLLGSAVDSAGVATAIRTPDVTSMPWTLRVASIPGDGESEANGRRRLMLWGFVLLLLLLTAGTYFILRSVTRELAVSRLQSDFVSTVSHEFRTPLTSVRQLSELLGSGRVATEAQKQECYTVLSRESERLQNMVEQLLDFGRIESGRYRYHFEPQDPRDLVSSVVSDFQEKVAEKGYSIELAVEAEVPVVTADREALGRALWNLLDNAVKYSPHSQIVWVDVGHDVRTLSIRVRDQGIGIPSNERQEIFKKFVRGSNSTGYSVKGTGIGLAMVRQIVEAHRGEVRVESEPDRGSTFTMLLPVGRRT